MKWLLIIYCFIFIQGCNSVSKQNIQANENIIDTAFLKTVKWDSLNTNIKYHVLKYGETLSDTNFHFAIKPLAVYNYMNKKFNTPNETKVINLRPFELKKIIWSDSFYNRKSFECLFKINSKIGLQVKPKLLQSVFIRPKNMSNKSINSLKDELRKEKFVDEIEIQPIKKTGLDTLTNDTSKKFFIVVKLKSDYWELNKIQNICSQLKQKPTIEDVFYNDLFSNRNENETIYLLTSEDNAN